VTRRGPQAGLPLFALLLSLAGPALAAELEEQLWHHRNLGKALYENPATQYDAVGELEKALALAPDSARERVNLGLALLRAGQTDEGIAQLEQAQKQDPSIPHTWFNLGIAYKRQSEYDKAIHQLEGMLELVPDEAITHYNLGVLYKLEGNAERSLEHFERAAELDPRLAGPHFQLATAYRQEGRTEDAARAMETFRTLKAAKGGSEDLEWSWYSEIYETLEPAPRPAPEETPRFAARTLTAEGETHDPGTAGLSLLRADGDALPDLVTWSARGVKLFLGDGRPVPLGPSPTGLGGLRNVRHVAAGDLDDDGLEDLAVLTDGGVSLWMNREEATPRFERLALGAFGASKTSEGQEEAEGNDVSKRVHDLALWLDYDHDYDLDLLLLGAEPALLRNGGDGRFGDRTGDFPFPAPGDPMAGRLGGAAAVARIDVMADSQATDVVVALAPSPQASGGTAEPVAQGILYRDLLGGRFEARPLPELPAGTRSLRAADVDHDGWTDLVAAGDGGVTLLVNDHHEGFRAEPVAATGGVAAVALLDLDGRGASDLVVAGASDLVAGGKNGMALLRDRGRGHFEAASLPDPLPAAVALAAADFDADGRADLAAVDRQGAVRLLGNRTKTDNRWLRVDLTGVKNPKLARGAEVEVKAGTLYQKRLYDGVPISFGLGDRGEVDTVRITWPNGLIQNQARQQADAALAVQEAPRLSGSCPMIFTWNGEGFEFITDVLGVAPLGASAGDGEYFPVDHDEGIRIAGESLAPRADGRYEIRMTEELREVAFLDEIRLAAVDHPADVEILTNDKFKGPPFPELRLYGASERIRPVAATDHRGRDVLERVLAKDETYPDGFERTYDGVAELHHLELDFGPEAPQGRALLVLSGWVDWADGSTFLASAQGAGPGLMLPALEVQDATGRWVTVLDDMGIPAGKPKTIAVDLTGKLPAGWRRLRIVTSLCVYWDEIYLTPDPGPPTVRVSPVPLSSAKLHFRGFSKVVIHPERKQPERFVYAERRPLAMWNPTPGLYTRYGAVGELLGTLDDRFVVMGSGDEVRMVFDPRDLPPVPKGWQRDFLLFVDGWAKDGDANTAYSQTVEPLPYHGMPRYPYEAPDAYPDDPLHTLYREHYLTRPALRLIRPLTEGLAPERARVEADVDTESVPAGSAGDRR